MTKIKLLVVILLMVLVLCTPTYVQATTGTVRSQSQLEKTLTDRK